MTPLTDKQLEAAAREYCRLVGIPPDLTVGGRPILLSITERIRRHDLETIALSVGRAEFPHD